jgi:hypothetical protein
LKRGTRAPTLALLLTIAAGVVVAAPSASADEAATLYNPATVWVIHLTLSAASEAALEAEPEGPYQPAEFSIAETEGTPVSVKAFTTPVKTEIRLKGSTSFETLSGKAAFKLKFKKNERPFGLKKMTLNNMVQDESMVHETLTYEAAREAGVPAPRTSFADVYVNGHDYGMHLDLETIDDQALERMFGTAFDAKTQHLYEGEDGTDVIPGDATAFEVDEGEETNIADLEALITAVNGSGAEPWSMRVAPFADLTEMTRMWALEKYVGQWDGYSGETGSAQPNNYYLYDDALGTFQMIPWGTDETFEADKHLAFDGQAGVLFDKCLEDQACAALYWHSLSAQLAAAKSLDLPARAAALDSLLAPWQAQEQSDGRLPYTRAQAHAAAVATGAYATSRVGEAEAWLAAHEPPEEPSDGGGGGTGGETGGGTGSHDAPTTTGPSNTPAGPTGGASTGGAPARIRRVGERGLTLTTALTLGAPGTVSQRATFDLDGRRHLACRIPAAEHEAGAVALRCPLLPDARRHLQDGPLRLHVVTTVRADAGATTKLPRLVELRRWPTHPSSS